MSYDMAEVAAFEAVKDCPNCVDQRPRAMIIDLSNRVGLKEQSYV